MKLPDQPGLLSLNEQQRVDCYPLCTVSVFRPQIKLGFFFGNTESLIVHRIYQYYSFAVKLICDYKFSFKRRNGQALSRRISRGQFVIHS